jgi:hypothetical protein
VSLLAHLQSSFGSIAILQGGSLFRRQAMILPSRSKLLPLPCK